MKVQRTFPIALLLICAGCDGGIWLNAKVTDAGGNPIPDANARLWLKDYGQQFDDKSNSAGCILLGGVIAPMQEQWNVSVEAVGYKPMNTQIISAESHTLHITLQSLTSAQASNFSAVDKNEGCPP